jgi:hypothetical protein
MHGMGTDRNITRRPSKWKAVRQARQPGAPRWAGLQDRNRAIRERSTTTTDRIIPAGTDTVEISNGAVGIGGRWDTFQSRLRQRGKEAAAGCKTYIVYAVFERDSADILGKAV